jgi:hypothetical protein
MDNKDIGLKFDPLWKGGKDTEGRTILQKITDTLEAAGITVSGIETWPPEEDGRVSVSMTVRPRPEPKPNPVYTDLYTFIEACLEYDDSLCESVETIYEKYKNYKSPKPVIKLNKFYFIPGVIKHFAARGKEVQFFPSWDNKGKNDPCLSNIRLIQFDQNGPDQKTAAALDAINAAKAPDDPPVVRYPCGECGLGDCDNCQARGGTPIKLYSPEEAEAAMKKGRILRNEKGDKFYWKGRFCREDKDGAVHGAGHISGLYEEARYV